jgi:predicted metal-dependent phosphoesterase TrpH
MTHFCKNKNAPQPARRDDCRASGKAHIPGALEGAQKLANGGAVTRGHFARFLVEAGKATTWRTSLKSIWRAGKPDTFRRSGVQ